MLVVPEARSPKARCHESQAPSEVLGWNPSCTPATAGGSRHPGLVTTSLPSLLRLPLSLFPLSMFPFSNPPPFSYKDIVLGFRTCPIP